MVVAPRAKQGRKEMKAKGEEEGSWCEVHCGQVCALGCGQDQERLLHLKFGVYRGLSVLHGGQQKMSGEGYRVPGTTKTPTRRC